MRMCWRVVCMRVCVFVCLCVFCVRPCVCACSIPSRVFIHKCQYRLSNALLMHSIHFLICSPSPPPSPTHTHTHTRQKVIRSLFYTEDDCLIFHPAFLFGYTIKYTFVSQVLCCITLETFLLMYAEFIVRQVTAMSRHYIPSLCYLPKHLHSTGVFAISLSHCFPHFDLSLVAMETPSFTLHSSFPVMGAYSFHTRLMPVDPNAVCLIIV